MLPEDEPIGDLARRMWRFAGIGAVGVIINVVVYRRTEVFFLERFSTDTQIALYTVPFSLVETLILLPKTVGMVIGPAVATLFGAGEHDRIASGFNRALRIVLPLSFFATAAAVAVGPTFIRLLYGSEFKGAGTVLVILISTLPFVPLMAVSGSVLLGIGKQWWPTGIGAVAAVANIGLDAWLIPRYNAVGAAVANTTSQIVGRSHSPSTRPGAWGPARDRYLGARMYRGDAGGCCHGSCRRGLAGGRCGSGRHRHVRTRRPPRCLLLPGRLGSRRYVALRDRTRKPRQADRRDSARAGSTLPVACGNAVSMRLLCIYQHASDSRRPRHLPEPIVALGTR